MGLKLGFLISKPIQDNMKLDLGTYLIRSDP